MKQPDFAIDFIISWVNYDDPHWQKKYQQHAHADHDYSSRIRYRDYGTLKYALRSIERYAPWVNKIFLVTDQQIPTWLCTTNDQLVVVDHQDYIPQRFLPTFDSNVIELNYFQLPELAEHFVCFNDDMLLNKPVSPSDFFDQAGNPRDSLALNSIMPTELFDHVYVNNLSIVNNLYPKATTMKHLFFRFFTWRNWEWNLLTLLLMPWPKFTRFYDPHIPLSFKKSSGQQILEQYPVILEKTGAAKFRTADDFSIWVIRYLQLLSSDFTPRSVHFGKQYNMQNWAGFVQDVQHSRHALLNINDFDFSDPLDFQTAAKAVEEALTTKFATQCSFEIKE
ncbi:stealth family protein [Bombilactobacillus thymidiniphilus]|uniref:Stealth family protein n=1 Tax=Bombilactobacillus thymidiniphilus TaxID=2923363 RepID=A0ABY4PDD4_9LACO|nr:stealth family protein [Bombilactobacillus thymidiniphilus]UQS83292.1 stealth family protein [Bombilactobacillus thymidiniphilus]